MLTWIKKRLTAPVFDDEDKTRVAAQFQLILVMILILVVVYEIVTLVTRSPDAAMSLAILAGTIPVEIFLLVLQRRGHVRFASTLLTTLLWAGITIGMFSTGGLDSVGVMSYFGVVAIAGLLLGWQGCLLFAVLSILSALEMFLAASNGVLPSPAPIPTSTRLAEFTVTVAGVAGLLYLTTRSLGDALTRVRRYAVDAAEQRENLEDVVRERTHDLMHRSLYLEATAEVAREATALMDLQDLLPRLVELISTRFGFYHVGIFLLDSVSEWAVLQAASSEGGKHMLARGYRVQVSSSAVVSQAVEHGKPQIVLDTTVDEERFANPDLPETCSMIALPLRVRGEIIGAMEVHSVEFAAFIGEDVSVLQTLTDQVAVAISNVRLFQQAQQALDAERRAYGELSRQAWAGLFAARPDLGFLRDKGGVTPLAEAAHQPQAAEGAPGGAALAAPIQVRGQTIGVIDATKRASAGRWSDDEATLLKVLAEQLGVALEGARLYTDAQRRAAHERLVGEVTARVRETLDVDIMLKTAVEEVRQALQLPEVTIRLVPPSAVEREAKNA